MVPGRVSKESWQVRAKERSLRRLPEPRDSVELAEIANDEMAALVAKCPDRFIAAAACSRGSPLAPRRVADG